MTTKKIKTSDILGDNYYIYELTSSNYTPALNDTITITCTMKDVYGTAASSKSITLYQNGTSKGAQTTNSSGVATWSITCSTAGLQKFNIKDTSIEVFVDNKEDKTNKVISWGQTLSNDNYPSEKLVKDSLDNVLENFRTKTITSTFPIIHTHEYEDNGITHTVTMYDGGSGHWELTINLTNLNNGKLALWNPEHGGEMEIVVNNGTLAIANSNGNIYLDGDTLPDDRESTATGTSGSDMPVTIPYENVVINFKNNGEDILITFSQTNTTIYSMTLHQNENWKYDIVNVSTVDNPNYTITGVSEYDIPNYYTETNYTFINPERYGDNDVIIPIYDFSIVEYTVAFTYDDVDWNNNEVSWLRFDSNSDHNQIYVINNKIYRINQNPPSSVESNEEWVEWIELNCPMLCQGTQITFKRYFLDGCVMTEWNDSNITVKSDDWYSYITNYNEPVPASFRSYDGIDSVNVTVRRLKKALPTLVSDFKDANQYEKISNKSSSITTDTGSTSKYPTIKAIEDYAQHLLNTVTLSTNKQEVDAGESFIITANVKDNNGNPIANKDLTLMQQYYTYSNPGMWATGWVKDEGFYVNDTIFKGDWSCSFKVNSTPDHTGLQLYISSEQRILFSTLGATSTSEIEITCSDNTITINVDGTDYGTTYTQNSNGTKVGFFTHEDYSVNIKDFVVNSGMLYKDCGSQTTDSNGNCTWSFNDGLPQGIYSFYINDVNINVFVGLYDAVEDSLNNKQDKLVSGTNLKTLDGVSLLGEGDVEIDVSCNSSGVLFEDACSSASGLSSYGSSECVRGSNATITMTYDSTENAYKLSGSGNYHAMIPIPDLDDEDNYTITADFKGQNIHFNGIGFFLDNRNDTTSYGQAFWLSVYDKRLDGHQFRLSSDGSGSDGATNSSISANTWYTLEMTVNGDILYAKLYDGDTVLSQSATSLTVENRQMGLFLYCETGSTNSICYVKNIVAKTIGGGGGSPIIFKDDCKADNTSDYVNTVHMGSENTNINFTFDSSTNGYLFTGTGGEYFGGKVIPFSFEDKISISCDAKLLNTSAYNQCTIGITDSLNPSMSGNYDFFRIRGDNRCDYIQNNRDTSIKTGLSLVNNWVTLEVSIDGISLTGKLYDENGTLLAQTSQITNTYSNPYIFIGLNCNGDNQKYVKNIVVKNTNTKLYLGNSIMTMIETALEHMITNWEDYD